MNLFNMAVFKAKIKVKRAKRERERERIWKFYSIRT